MKRFLLIFMIASQIGFGQNLSNREVKINYTNGTEVFDILIEKNPDISFDEDKEYFWYTEFTKIKTTKGGSGGHLLNGNYKFYNESGDLKQDINFELGLKNGIQREWDSTGVLELYNDYIKGKAIYTKFRNDDGIFISWENPLDPFVVQQSKGAIKKIYSKDNRLEVVIKYKDMFQQQVTQYHEYSDQIEAQYNQIGISNGPYYGKYTQWYENGQIKVDGQFYEPEEFTMGGLLDHRCSPEVRVGTWTWYSKDGSIDSESTYKIDISYWDNGNIKSVGGLIKSGNEWYKNGKWVFHDEDESWEKEEKEYSWGNEVVND